MRSFVFFAPILREVPSIALIQQHHPTANMVGVAFSRQAKLKSLIANISEEVVLNGEDIKFDYQRIPALKDYVPYHQDIDLDSRLPKESPPTICPEDTNEDPFIIDKVIDKRFNKRKAQYEFLVSWVEYSDQTWVLPDNVPSEKVIEFDQDSCGEVLRKDKSDKPYRLREARKKTVKGDMINIYYCHTQIELSILAASSSIIMTPFRPFMMCLHEERLHI